MNGSTASNKSNSPPTILFMSPNSYTNFKRAKSRRCSPQLMRRRSNGNGNGNNCSPTDGKNSFMEDVWKVLTPEMVNKLIDILVQDFKMTREQATTFLKQQRELCKKSQLAAAGKCQFGEKMVPATPNMDIRSAIVKELIDVIACKLSDYLTVMMCAKKSKRQEILAEKLIINMNSFFGTQDGDDTKVSQVISFLSDKISVWLDNLFHDNMFVDDKANDQDGSPSVKIVDS